MVAAQQPARQRGTHCSRAIGLAAPLHRLRLSLPLQRCEPERRSRSREPALWSIRFSRSRIRQHQPRRLRIPGRLLGTHLGPHHFRISHRKRKWIRRQLSAHKPRASASIRMPTCNSNSRWGRLSAVAGGRFVHSSVFGNTGVPRVALTLLARRGGETLLCNASAFFLCHRIQGAAP